MINYCDYIHRLLQYGTTIMLVQNDTEYKQKDQDYFFKIAYQKQMRVTKQETPKQADQQNTDTRNQF